MGEGGEAGFAVADIVVVRACEDYLPYVVY